MLDDLESFMEPEIDIFSDPLNQLLLAEGADLDDEIDPRLAWRDQLLVRQEIKAWRAAA